MEGKRDTVKHEYCRVCRKTHVVGDCEEGLPAEMVSISLGRERGVKVIFVGDAGVGKSTLYRECLRSYGVNELHRSVFEVTLPSLKPIQVQLEDTADQEKYQSLAVR